MTNIKITGNRARTLGKVAPSIYAFRRQMEGRTSLNKDGSFSFEPTPLNMSLWAFNYPQSAIDDQRKAERVFADLPVVRPGFVLKRDHRWWQQESFDKLKDLNVFALLYEPGGGKSKALTDMGTRLYCEGKIDAMIIWTPNSVVSEQWARRVGGDDLEAQGMLERDIAENIDWSVWLWAKTKKAALEYEQLTGFQIIVMNVDAGKTPSGKKLMHDFIARHKGRMLFAIDESHLIKTRGYVYKGKTTGARHLAACEYGAKTDYRAILTGTPIGLNLTDLWSQFLFLDEKIIGIRYKTAFLAEYCVTKYNPHSPYTPDIVGHKNVDKFFAKIDPYIYRITQEELGLEKVFDEFEFSLYPEQQKHYDAVKQLFITQLDNGEFLTAQNAISAMVRMQQISNGFLVREDGTFQLLPNARVDALKAWLETISDEKIVIWSRFKQDMNILSKEFGNELVEFSGNIGKSQRIENKERFINDPAIRFFAATPDSAGTGTDGLQVVCNRAVRLSLSYNYILYNQSENRTSRIGGKGTAFYTDIIGKGTVDRGVLRNLAAKKNLSNLALDDIRRLVIE